MYSNEINKNSNLASLLEAYLGKDTSKKILHHFKGECDIDIVLKKIYRLWHKSGTLRFLGMELNISSNKAHHIIKLVRERNIIKNFSYPKRPLGSKQLKQILATKELYEKLSSLSLVGKRLGVSRERVRQILEKGNDYGIIEYKPQYLKKFDKIIDKVKKEEIEKLYVQYGSIKKLLPDLENKIGEKINENYIKKFFEIYGIERNYLNLQHRKNKCCREYENMVQELGFHPTTTIMSKRPEWRTLWSRIGKMWGCVDNFRKEFGIPIPNKGSPTFKQDMQKGVEDRLNELRRIKSEKLQSMIEFINSNSPVSRMQIEIHLNLTKATTINYTEELVEKDRIDWMCDGKRYLYFKKI